ncbi:MAG: hypothetical protein IT458_06920 [Planctomycetes bacterium]|nr:hypothetical protein [Planctomycetota bacterium]
MIRSLPLLLLSSALLAQQTTAPRPAEGPGTRPQDLVAQLAKSKVQVDLERATVSIPVRMNAPQNPIEFVLIHRMGKRHEAVLVTDVKASLIQGGLLLLGFREGRNATYKEKDPPPSREEIEKGADPLVVEPPKGMPVWFTVKYTDDAGKAHELAVEDLIVDLTTQRPLEDAQWIYLGGRMAPLYRNEPPVFVADYEGNLVSSIYFGSANHLVTIAHERAREDENFWIDEKVCPPPGTEMTLTIHAREPALVRERNARLAKERAAGAASRPGAPIQAPPPPSGGEPPRRDK